jgi:hypothetical protein
MATGAPARRGFSSAVVIGSAVCTKKNGAHYIARAGDSADVARGIRVVRRVVPGRGDPPLDGQPGDNVRHRQDGVALARVDRRVATPQADVKRIGCPAGRQVPAVALNLYADRLSRHRRIWAWYPTIRAISDSHWAGALSKTLDLSEAADESRPENEPERDLHRLWPESTAELYKLPNYSRTMPATPGGSRT